MFTQVAVPCSALLSRATTTFQIAQIIKLGAALSNTKKSLLNKEVEPLSFDVPISS